MKLEVVLQELMKCLKKMFKNLKNPRKKRTSKIAYFTTMKGDSVRTRKLKLEFIFWIL